MVEDDRSDDEVGHHVLGQLWSLEVRGVQDGVHDVAEQESEDDEYCWLGNELSYSSEQLVVFEPHALEEKVVHEYENLNLISKYYQEDDHSHSQEEEAEVGFEGEEILSPEEQVPTRSQVLLVPVIGILGVTKLRRWIGNNLHKSPVALHDLCDFYLSISFWTDFFLNCLYFFLLDFLLVCCLYFSVGFLPYLSIGFLPSRFLPVLTFAFMGPRSSLILKLFNQVQIFS